MSVYTGIVEWFSNTKGYGFISWEKDGIKQKDMFVYYSDIVSEGFKTLNKFAKVQFELGTNHKGDPKAINVKII